MIEEQQLTDDPYGHILTNIGVWSPCGEWIVYDVRSDATGMLFDGTRIERVNVRTKEVQVLYQSRNGAYCGVATCSPVDDRVVFILGPEHPTPDWSYGPAHRQGVIVDASRPKEGIVNLDARDLVPPFTPGALQGGTHLHTFSPDGRSVLFTYDDHPAGQANRRNVGVALPWGPVVVPKRHPRNHDGSHHCMVLTRTDGEIVRASEEAWLGDDLVVFQGQLRDGRRDLFLVGVPTAPGEKGDPQQRLTQTQGIAGVRHWPRAAPDFSKIGLLMPDRFGIVQLWYAELSGRVRQLTSNESDIESAFTWGERGIAHVFAGKVCLTDPQTGITRELTQGGGPPPRAEACVLSPDEKWIAYVRPVNGVNQIFVVGTD